jgi:predicted ArsR family transcriptional regulator
MDPDGQREYRALAGVLADELAASARSGRRAAEIGRRWGRGLAAEEVRPPRTARASRERLRGILGRLGFAPDDSDDPRRIPLRNCPFLELAHTSTRVVCPVHLGLMQGLLETWRAPLTVEGLDTFAEPDLCLVHLGPAATTAAAAP